jgi:hypothetical protein
MTFLDRHSIGANNPPSAIDDARAAFAALSAYLADTPVIETDDEARAAKLQIDRASATLGSLETARDAETKPLYSAWQTAIAKYKPATESLSKLLGEIKSRLSAYMRMEEDRRWREAGAKRLATEEAIRVAHEAENAENEARENAAQGEFVDIGAAMETADAAFSQAKTLDHQASIAERDAHVRIGGGFGRVATLRSKETLILDDAVKALISIGVTGDIREALLKGARAFRKLHGKLPAGISSDQTRAL